MHVISKSSNALIFRAIMQNNSMLHKVIIKPL